MKPASMPEVARPGGLSAETELLLSSLHDWTPTEVTTLYEQFFTPDQRFAWELYIEWNYKNLYTSVPTMYVGVKMPWFHAPQGVPHTTVYLDERKSGIRFARAFHYKHAFKAIYEASTVDELARLLGVATGIVLCM